MALTERQEAPAVITLLVCCFAPGDRPFSLSQLLLYTPHMSQVILTM